ncbi:arginine--tRNA ligase, cytoplasmic [Artemisia annua]|uniref:arginine--tRNA ligase n=1 Tax=Artemisia annua TaxID=35608 RepID=A0A2U1NGB0_ARTAN|nr:arginine--tRNA ligase, cytoplasmic [Artemisia annua]
MTTTRTVDEDGDMNIATTTTKKHQHQTNEEKTPFSNLSDDQLNVTTTTTDEIKHQHQTNEEETPFSHLSDDQLTAIFGEGPPFRFEFCSCFLIYRDIIHHNFRLFGTIQAAVGGFSPDPLLQQNGFSDIFNREFTNPVRVRLRSHELYDLRYASLPVSSTSVVQIAAKLYVTSDTADDMEIFTQDYMDIDTRPAEPEQREPVDSSVLLEQQALWDRFFKEIDNKLGSNSKAVCTLQKPVKKKPIYIDDEALQVCDAHEFINIPDKPNGGSGFHTIEGKDGSLEISYIVLKYAVYADLEIEFESTSEETKLSGRIRAYYGQDFDYDQDFDYGQPVECYHVMLWDFDAPAFVKRGKLNLMRSVLAVPAKYSLIIAACLDDATSREEILSNSYEFFVPRDFRSSVVTIAGKDCSLKVTVNWRLPNSPAPSSNSSVSRLVKTERSKFGANSKSIMADPDERNRWSLQEEIAKVFNTSLERTFSPREAVSCSISTCTKEDGGDYLCSSVLHIWPELRDTSYRGPKHAGVAVKDDIMASEYKDMMERCVVCGPGFVKFQLCREWIAKSIHKMLRDGIDTWAPKLSVKKTSIYSFLQDMSQDILDMGHLRSASVGGTLARMLDYSGVVVHREIIHDGDHLDIEGNSGILDLLRGNGLPVVSEGNETVFIEGRKLPLVYLTALRHALDVEKADWMVYVTDVGQRDYIETCITAAKRVGLITDDHSIFPVSHAGFGHVQGDDLERFQTSNNEVVSLVNLLDEAKTRCKVLLAGQAGMANECTAEELEYAAESLGYRAVMYENLKNNRLTNYTFSIDQMFNEGNTAVYLHYTHHQVLSIIMSSSKDIEDLMAEELILMNDDERELGLHLLRFTELPLHVQHARCRGCVYTERHDGGEFIWYVIVRMLQPVRILVEVIKLRDIISGNLNSQYKRFLGEACTILAPHILCEYLYELCKKFNGLRSSVWQVVGSSEKTSKLSLCKATEVVMRKCFDLLGITPIFKIESLMLPFS